jgi:putative ABC transport system permease protein
MSAWGFRLRLGIRTWMRTPLLAATAIATLALGVGVSTAVWSVANGVLFNVVPWPREPDRMVFLTSLRLSQDAQQEGTTPAAFLDWRAQASAFDGMFATQFVALSLTDGDESAFVEGSAVSVESAALFGVTPLLGRLFSPQDAAPDAPRVALLSQGLFERRYGGDASIVGRTIEMDGEPVTVIGVLQREQFFPGPFAQIVVPLKLEAASASRAERILDVFGLLREDATLAQAQAELDVIAKRLQEQYPATDAGWTVRAQYVYDAFSGGQRTRAAVALMLAAVGFVLLIVSANVANLLLARSAARTKEMATRAAVGASRMQLGSQLLLESAVLGIAALPFALVIGSGTVDYFLSLVPPTITWMDTLLRFDAPVLFFAFGVSLATVVIFGLIPALQASRVDLQRVLKEGGGRGATVARPWLRQVLAVAQLGLAISLLVTTVLIVQSFNVLQSRDPGLDADRLLVTQIPLPAARYPAAVHWREFQRAMAREIASDPNVESVGAVMFAPFGYPGPTLAFSIDGRDAVEGDVPGALFAPVTSDYFRTLGLDIVRGRGIEADDREGGVPVTVVNEALAQRYFPGEDPIGRRIQSGETSYEIVGVVRSYSNVGLRDPPVPQAFTPFEQGPTSTIGLLVRAKKGDPGAVAPAVRRALRAVDAALAVPALLTMEQRVVDQIWAARFLKGVMLLLSLVALVLAVLGVYAVISYSVAQRSQEFAIRAALGAEPAGIARLVLRQASLLALWGTLIAFGICWLLRPMLGSILYSGVSFSPAAFAATAALLALVALLAAMQPAMRATRADPMLALRAE